jgi:hypothetical protein
MTSRAGRICVMLMLTLCFMAFTGTSHGQTAENSPQSSELLGITVDIIDHGSEESVIKNLVVEFVNATFLPFNASLPAFNDYFRTARFSVVSAGDVFFAYLRVSYNVTLDAGTAEAYSDDVLGEFREAFNLTLNVNDKTHVVNDETATIDVYYKLNDISRGIEPFEELTKYRPAEGFGQLVTRDLLSFYMQGGPETDYYIVYALEYNLARIDQGLVWKFRLELGHSGIYQGEDHIDVSLNELLNHSGSVKSSTLRSSEVCLYVGKREVFPHKAPLQLSLSSSSPSYTDLKEEGDYMVATWNLTGSVPDIIVRINIAREGFNLVYAAIIIVAVSTTSAGIFLFVRVHRKKLQKVKNAENSK